MSNLPRRIVQDQLVFEAVNLADRSDRFFIHAETELGAKAQMVDHLGYVVRQNATSGFVLCDAEEEFAAAIPLKATTAMGAHDEVLAVARWSVGEAINMIGGALGSGFGDCDD